MREKIYCTRCGREIRDGLLYCDRCGQSVKKSIEQQKPLKYRQIEEIHKERRVRKQRQQEIAVKRKQQKQKALNRTRALVFILLLLVIALVSSIVTYVRFISSESGMKDMDDMRQEDLMAAEATAAPSETANVVINTNSDMETNSEYVTYTIGDQVVSYPGTFTGGITQSGETARFSDPSGDGVIVIGQESVSGSASDMMLEYYSKTGLTGEPEVNSASKTRYLITYTKNGTVTHRKLVIKGSTAVYYEISYSSTSEKKSEYEKYIDDMDKLFKEQ